MDYWNAHPDSGSGGTVGWANWGGGTWGESYGFKQDPLSFNAPIIDRPTMRLLNTYWTGGSWKCKGGGTGTGGTWPGTWPDGQFP